MAANMTKEIFNEGEDVPREARAETGRLLPGVINCQAARERYVGNALPRSHYNAPGFMQPLPPTSPSRVITAGCALCFNDERHNHFIYPERTCRLIS